MESRFPFGPTFKLWLYGNHKPVITGTDEGIWRRIRLIPFTVQIPKGEQDPELPAKLRSELSGILTWAVSGWKAYQQHGLAVPSAVTDATDTFRSESDILGLFIEESCIEGPDKTARGGELYEAYKIVGSDEWLESVYQVSGLRVDWRNVASPRRRVRQGTWSTRA